MMLSTLYRGLVVYRAPLDRLAADVRAGRLTDGELADKMGRSAVAGVWATVAANVSPRFTHTIRVILASASNPQRVIVAAPARAALAQRNDMPIPVLRALFSDPVWNVLEAAYMNPVVGADADSFVQQLVATRGGRLVFDPEVSSQRMLWVRLQGALRNPNIQTSTIHQVASLADLDPYTMNRLAMSPHLPKEIAMDWYLKASEHSPLYFSLLFGGHVPLDAACAERVPPRPLM